VLKSQISQWINGNFTDFLLQALPGDPVGVLGNGALQRGQDVIAENFNLLSIGGLNL
jgi:hypothetical protein